MASKKQAIHEYGLIAKRMTRIQRNRGYIFTKVVVRSSIQSQNGDLFIWRIQGEEIIANKLPDFQSCELFCYRGAFKGLRSASNKNIPLIPEILSESLFPGEECSISSHGVYCIIRRDPAIVSMLSMDSTIWEDLPF